MGQISDVSPVSSFPSAVAEDNQVSRVTGMGRVGVLAVKTRLRKFTKREAASGARRRDGWTPEGSRRRRTARARFTTAGPGRARPHFSTGPSTYVLGSDAPRPIKTLPGLSYTWETSRAVSLIGELSSQSSSTITPVQPLSNCVC